MEAKLTEVITVAIPETIAGTPSYAGSELILEKFSQSDAVAVGSGISTNPETAKLVRHILTQAAVPLVLDADGINCISEKPDLLRNYDGPCIITPHVGEFARLTGITTDEVLDDLSGTAKKYAEKTGVVVVLKSAQTVVAAPDGQLYINITGNAGMASAGVGDVLTGIVASLLGQGLNAVDAARLGVFLHGTAGDMAAEAMTEPSLIASDLLDTLPVAIASLEQAD
jgi:NAD(P)H-hydrate epimerase